MNLKKLKKIMGISNEPKNDRKLVVFDRKLEGSHSMKDCFFEIR